MYTPGMSGFRQDKILSGKLLQSDKKSPTVAKPKLYWRESEISNGKLIVNPVFLKFCFGLKLHAWSLNFSHRN